MSSSHLYHLSKMKPQDQTEAGSRVKASRKNFPILQGISLYKLRLEHRGIREPHWHANAHELGYCLKGTVLINLYHTGDARSTFLVKEGDVFLIPSGALHHIENVGEGSAEILLSFSHEDPEDFDLSGTLGAFSNSVLGNTWNVKACVFESLSRSLKPSFATLRKSSLLIPEEALYATSYRYHLEASEPLLCNEGGSVRMARENVWPIAQSQAIYSLRLTNQGMREPHWHPETAELGYVRQGKGRMTILSPKGDVDTYIIEEGDIYFIPKAYPHHIENLSEQELHLLIFFDQGMPKDIGFTGSILSYSHDVLESITGSDPGFFKQLSKYDSDLFIVKKINPTDPIK